MIESPILLEIVSESRQKDLLRFLTARFGDVPPDISDRLRAVQDMDELDILMDLGASCADLEAFARGLRSQIAP